EAKENLKIQRETRTFATITIQNYFRMYTKLAGMTGTAATEAEELFKVYKLEVTQIPTNKPMVRKDNSDLVYKTEQGKWDAVVAEVKERNEAGQPVLIGTTSVEKSERLSDQLRRHGIKHEVLNAKNHEREALIIADAGQRSAVTLSTNMAGRGVDILLGEGITDLGGLHVIGTERHEARRIDNQLRGRSGRQGDPGSSRFFSSLEDDLIRIFASERVAGLGAMLHRPELGATGVGELRKQNELRDRVAEIVEETYEAREKELGEERTRAVERWVLLRTIDTHWIEHLTAMEELREGIYLRGYGQQDPLVAYKREAHGFFEEMEARIASGVAQTILRVTVRTAEQAEQEEKTQTTKTNAGSTTTTRTSGNGRPTSSTAPSKLPGRNEPCWCGSGKK